MQTFKSSFRRSLQTSQTFVTHLRHSDAVDSALSDSITEQFKANRANEREEMEHLNNRHRSEILLREKVENTLKEFRQDIDYAEQIHSDMETENEFLKQEITFLKKLHSKEIDELQAQIQKQHVQIDMDMVNPDLTAALRDVRLQYEMLATKHIRESEELYRSKLVSMSESVTHDNEALRKARQEVHDYRRQVQTLSCEVTALKETIKKMQDSHSTEADYYEGNIMKLKSNIHGMTSEISHHVLKYQELLDVKMALDIEITAYRKLLEGGESRIIATTNSTLDLIGGYYY